MGEKDPSGKAGEASNGDSTILRQLITATDTLNIQSKDNAKSLQALAFLLRASESSFNNVAHGTNTCVRESYLTVESSLKRFQEQLKCLISSVDVILQANDRNLRFSGDHSQLLAKSLNQQSEMQGQLTVQTQYFSSMKESLEGLRRQVSQVSSEKDTLNLILEGISAVSASTFSKSEASSLVNELVSTKHAVAGLESGIYTKLSSMEDLMQRDEVANGMEEIRQLRTVIQRLELVQSQGITNIEKAQSTLLKELKENSNEMNGSGTSPQVLGKMELQAILDALSERKGGDSQDKILCDHKESLERETREYEERLRALKKEVALLEQKKTLQESECKSLEEKLNIRETQFIQLERRSHELEKRVSNNLVLNANSLLSASASTLSEMRESMTNFSGDHGLYDGGVITPQKTNSPVDGYGILTENKNSIVSFPDNNNIKRGKENEIHGIRFVEMGPPRGKPKPRSISHQL